MCCVIVFLNIESETNLIEIQNIDNKVDPWNS